MCLSRFFFGPLWAPKKAKITFRAEQQYAKVKTKRQPNLAKLARVYWSKTLNLNSPPSSPKTRTPQKQHCRAAAPRVVTSGLRFDGQLWDFAFAVVELTARLQKRAINKTWSLGIIFNLLSVFPFFGFLQFCELFGFVSFLWRMVLLLRALFVC